MFNEVRDIDPIKFCHMCWPGVNLYDRQREIFYSVCNNDDTIVPAGNMLGKDFVAALVAIYFFMTRSPCRVITTSVDQGQLEKVLWGEINNFISSSRYQLPLVSKHCDIRRLVYGVVEPKSYIIGRVAKAEEGLLGHHLPKGLVGEPRTLMIYDEASGISTDFKAKTDTWAHRTLIIGNPYPCSNFFYTGVKAGPVMSPDGKKKYREIIKIKAEDSPNVRFAQAQIKEGLPVTNEILIPGVLDYYEYLKRRAMWDAVRQCVSLDADFYEGAQVLMYPPEWLNRSERIAAEYYKPRGIRKARAIGVDTAEGGDSSVWSAVDDDGLIEQVSKKTPNTAIIPGETLAFARKWGCADEDIIFDAGGGGKEHADRLRAQGHRVRTVAFGETASSVDRFKRIKTKVERTDDVETRLIYKNRRAEMYGLLRQFLDPANEEQFGIPAQYTELRRQLAPIPLLWDEEGRLYMLPKKNKDSKTEKDDLYKLLGCSPDEADSLVLGVFGMTHKATRVTAGVIR